MRYASQLFHNVPDWFVAATVSGEPKGILLDQIKAEISKGISENGITSDLWTDEFIKSYAETIFQIYSEQMNKRKS